MPKRESKRESTASSSKSTAEPSPADLAQLLALLQGWGPTSGDMRAASPTRRRHRARRTPTYYRVRVDLDGAKPPIWRRLRLASELRLDEVHLVLQAAFDWYGHHLHEFSVGGRTDRHAERFLGEFQVEDGDDGTPDTDVRLDQVMHEPGDKLSYWYDFGDDWWHTVKLEAVERRDEDAPMAIVVAGRRAAPPDDCGGIWGYESLLEVLADPSHPEHAEMAEWFVGMYGGESPTDFDPAYLDLDELDERVQSLFD